MKLPFLLLLGVVGLVSLASAAKLRWTSASTMRPHHDLTGDTPLPACGDGRQRLCQRATGDAPLPDGQLCATGVCADVAKWCKLLKTWEQSQCAECRTTPEPDAEEGGLCATWKTKHCADEGTWCEVLTPGEQSECAECRAKAEADRKAMSDAKITGGDGFIQVGAWRLGTKSFNIPGLSIVVKKKFFAINYCGEKQSEQTTAQLFTSVGTIVQSAQEKKTWNLCDAALSVDGKPTNVHSGNGYIEFAGVWRIGNINDNHLSIAHKDAETGITNTAMIWKKDGSRHPGPRTPPDDFSPWSSKGGKVRYGYKFLQFGTQDANRFRFAVFSDHSSIANGKNTAVIYRGDGTVHGGPRNDFHVASRSSIGNLPF